MRALAGLGVALAACFSPSAQVGAPCSSTGQCPAGQHCNQQVDPPVCAAADARPADAPPDAPPSCATSVDCAAVAPVCDTTTHTCRACAADVECGEAAICVEHAGQCVGDSNVLFVAPAGVNQGACTRAAPCATIDFTVGLVANNQKTIAIADGAYGLVLIKPFDASSLTISGPDRDPAGVALGGGFIVEAGAKRVLLEGATASNAAGRAIDNRGTLTLSRVRVTGAVAGLVSSNNFTLDIWDSVVVGNMNIGIDVTQTTLELSRTTVMDNGGGGISIANAATTIESSVIAQNGGLFAPFGGVRYQNLGGKAQAFRFNTVASNVSSLSASAVACPTTLALESSIFSGDPSAVMPQLSPACAPTYSLFSGTAPAGTGNLSGDPAYAGPGDFHIGASSAARDAADPAATTARDIDNEVRPQGGGRDIGADEVP